MKLVLVIVALFISKISTAQELKFAYNVGWKGGGSGNPIELASFHNSDKSLTCLALKRNDSLKIFLVNKNMELLNVTGCNLGTDEEFLGGFIKENKIVWLVNRSRDKQVFSWVYDIETDSSQNFLMPFDLKGKRTLGHVGTGNFYYLTAEKKQPVISVFEFTTDGKIVQQDYDLSSAEFVMNFDRNELWRALSKSYGLSREIDIAVVGTEADCPIDIANAPNKIYFRNDTLLLLMDNKIGSTSVFSFDLLRKKVDQRNINREGITPAKYGFTSQCVYNSFLLKDQLYYVFATEQSLVLTVNNFYNNKELKRFYANRDEEITFKNTPVMQEGGGTMYSMNARRELGKTKQMLDKLLAGRAVITAFLNQYNQSEITIGAYKQMQSSTGGWTSFGGGAPIYTGGISTRWQRVTRFKTILDAQTLDHIPGEPKPSVDDVIDAYTKKIKIPSGGESLFTIDNNFYYAFYDRDYRGLVILKL